MSPEKPALPFDISRRLFTNDTKAYFIIYFIKTGMMQDFSCILFTGMLNYLLFE